MFDSIDLIDHLLFKDNRLVIINNAKRRFSCAQVDSAVKRHRSGLLCFKDISRGRLYAREAASIEYQRVRALLVIRSGEAGRVVPYHISAAGGEACTSSVCKRVWRSIAAYDRVFDVNGTPSSRSPPVNNAAGRC